MFLSPIYKTRPWHLWASTSIQYNSARQQPMWMPSWHKERLPCTWLSNSLGFLALQACYPPTRAANLEMKDSIWASNPQLKFCDSWLEKWKVKLFRSSGAQNGMNLEDPKDRKVNIYRCPSTSMHSLNVTPCWCHETIISVASEMLTVEVSEDSNSGHRNAVSWWSGCHGTKLTGWWCDWTLFETQSYRRLLLHGKGRCECGPDLREMAESHRRRLFRAFSLQDCVW